MSDIEKRAIELRDKYCPPGDYDYSDILDAIRESLTPQWQPIEAAPKDGTRIFLWDSRDGGCAVTGKWRHGDDENHGSITHWMPLPEEPNVQK